VLGTPGSFQGLEEDLLGGLDPAIPELGKLSGVSFATEDGRDDGNAGVSLAIADHIVQLDVHLLERLLHPLDRSGHLADQGLSLPYIISEFPGQVVGLETAIEQAKRVELLQPPGIAHIALPTRHVLHMPRVHQIYFKAIIQKYRVE